MRTAVIEAFLKKNSPIDLYSKEMECQVNVAADGGQRVEGEYKGKNWHGWTDGVTKWKPFRIPWNAKENPTYEDSPLKWDFEAHVEGIGMTGWNWVKRRSQWVAFDFDAMVGHSDKHSKKLTEIELKQIIQLTENIPWITIRKSTSGKGLHLYVFLDVETKNHDEHAALARAVLSQLSGLVGFNFLSKVDTCGGNMWVWHRKMRGTDGLTLIKQGEVLTSVPANWKEHINVVASKCRKANPDINDQADFIELQSQRNHIALDDEHRKLVNYLESNSLRWWWNSDFHMMVTHTTSLAQAHEALGLKGIFKTISEGNEAGDHNCFCNPLRNGAWVVRRYTKGTEEATTWIKDRNGWTQCYYNKEPDLRTAASIYKGMEIPPYFHFNTMEDLVQCLRILGIQADVDPYFYKRKASIRVQKDGNYLLELEYQDGDIRPPDWFLDKKRLKKQVSGKRQDQIEFDGKSYDDTVRHLITQGGEDYGWAIQSDGIWRIEPLAHVKMALESMGLKANDSKNTIGGAVFKPWTIVNLPFQDEYPGDRQWNRNGCKLRFHISTSDTFVFPHWMKILEHLGKNLDPYLTTDWCKQNNIIKGSDYLQCWIASMFRYPQEPLPYLFFYSREQGTGKSTLHEAIQLLVTGGVVEANTALKSQGNYNAELESAILCYVEEVDMKSDKIAYNRMKNWVTSPTLTIHRKGCTPYSTINTTHYIQTSNHETACPIFPGDSRITMIRVDPLQELIPRTHLHDALQKEAPDFLGHIMNLEIPKPIDRLAIPVIKTDDKEAIEESNKSILEQFIDEKCFPIPGAIISFAEFYDEFVKYIGETDSVHWSKNKVAREFPLHFPKGRLSHTNEKHIGNLSFNKDTPPKRPLTLKEGVIR